MQMTDEQVWTDLERFAAAMKRGATVVLEDEHGAELNYNPRWVCKQDFVDLTRIREIIEPPQKKVRPLNAEEWDEVVGCVRKNKAGESVLVRDYSEMLAAQLMEERRTCHPPGNSKDVRKLWVEE